LAYCKPSSAVLADTSDELVRSDAYAIHGGGCCGRRDCNELTCAHAPCCMHRSCMNGVTFRCAQELTDTEVKGASEWDSPCLHERICREQRNRRWTEIYFGVCTKGADQRHHHHHHRSMLPRHGDNFFLCFLTFEQNFTKVIQSTVT
jgi:hypothetical protein